MQRWRQRRARSVRQRRRLALRLRYKSVTSVAQIVITIKRITSLLSHRCEHQNGVRLRTSSAAPANVGTVPRRVRLS